MFRYINMPKLVATYLREFSTDVDGKPSILFKFIFCLCLPFVSSTFRVARLKALAIAECKNSAEQIKRVFNNLTAAKITNIVTLPDYETEFTYERLNSSSTTEDAEYVRLTGFNFDGTDETPEVLYDDTNNVAVIDVQLNGVSQSDVVAYLDLLIPFYVHKILNFS